MVVKVVMPVDHRLFFYHYNPLTAPRFAIYQVAVVNQKAIFSLEATIHNPFFIGNGDVCDTALSECRCSKETIESPEHQSIHYQLLSVMVGCQYLLADRYCKNLKDALGNYGVSIGKIPPIIHHVDHAIKNFLIGASIANNVQKQNHAS